MNCGLACGLRPVFRDGDAGVLRAGGPQPGLHPGVCGGLCAGIGLRVSARGMALRCGRGDLGADCARAVAKADAIRRQGMTTVLRDKINESVKTAMKAQDKVRLGTLRLMNAAIKNADIEAERAGKKLADDDLIGVLQKMVKQRQDSIEAYDKGGRKDLADQERGEIEVIKGFLPQQMSEAEAKAAIAAVIKDTGAAGIKDMGKVMAALKERHAGKMDFGKASGLVKGLLSG